jgi:hypothetical protein
MLEWKAAILTLAISLVATFDQLARYANNWNW